MIARARERRASGRPTIFFLDEIHRFNKAQQDALLPAVEEGLITLIGATTENPYFEVNSALLSRAQIYEFRPLTDDGDRGAASCGRSATSAASLTRRTISDEALEMLATRAGGDARVALAALERAVEATAAAGETEIGVAAVEDALQRKALLYDREGDKHYDYISAWIKATRGSDVDASIYYLAVMLEGGEDPRFIARRMVIFASEDIGNADPQALLVANAAAQAVDRVGLPECALNLSQAAAYLALAPKSNASTRAISKATRARPRARRRRAAALPPGRPLPGRQEARPRRGLPLPARRARRRSPTSRCRRSRSEASASTSRPTAAPRRSCASGWSACAGCAPRISAALRPIRRISTAQPFRRGRVLRLSDALAVVRFAGASA